MPLARRMQLDDAVPTRAGTEEIIRGGERSTRSPRPPNVGPIRTAGRGHQADRLEGTTAELGGQVTRNSPLMIGLLKEELHVLAGATPMKPGGFERIQALRRRIYDSADYQEGIRSFFERRAPHFEGH